MTLHTFDPPLVEGRLDRRYKRFLADVHLPDGSLVTAHCPNPGSMRSLLDETGPKVWLRPNNDPRKKLKFGWELLQVGEALVGINTSRANLLVGAALTQKAIAPLAEAGEIRREVRYGENSRIDFLLGGDCFLEVKSVTMSRQRGLAEFPDSVTARGTKHLNELSKIVLSGQRAVLFFLVQRNDCTRVSVAADLDPAYAKAFEEALQCGVEVLAYSCKITPQEISLDKALKVITKGPFR